MIISLNDITYMQILTAGYLLKQQAFFYKDINIFIYLLNKGLLYLIGLDQ